MPAPGTQFAGPILSGPRQYNDDNGPANVGLADLAQTLTLTQNGTNNVSGTFTIPEHCQISEFIVDNRIVWNAAVSAGLTIGIAALGTEYASSMDVKAAVARFRAPVAPTAAQMLALKDTGTNKSVVCTVNVAAGATTTGETIITMKYTQTTAWMSP
jgi:hypothetical protein